MLLKEMKLSQLLFDSVDDNILCETVSMWLDEKTDGKIDDVADLNNMPPGSLAAVYRKEVAEWVNLNRYGKGRELHNSAWEGVKDFIRNKDNTRDEFPVEWNRVKKFRRNALKKKYHDEVEERRKNIARKEREKERNRQGS
jgi:hypothetical protein